MTGCAAACVVVLVQLNTLGCKKRECREVLVANQSQVGMNSESVDVH